MLIALRGNDWQRYISCMNVQLTMYILLPFVTVDALCMIAPDPIEDVESVVTFQLDGTPRVEIRFTVSGAIVSS